MTPGHDEQGQCLFRKMFDCRVFHAQAKIEASRFSRCSDAATDLICEVLILRHLKPHHRRYVMSYRN
jgi:hypothetical protein